MRQLIAEGLPARIGSKIALYAVLTVLAICFLLPLIWMVSSSLKPEAEVLSIPPSFIPSAPQWSNYAVVFERIPVFFFNSALLAVVNVVGVLIVASMAGYAFGRLQFAGRDFAFMVLLATAI